MKRASFQSYELSMLKKVRNKYQKYSDTINTLESLVLAFVSAASLISKEIYDDLESLVLHCMHKNKPSRLELSYDVMDDLVLTIYDQAKILQKWSITNPNSSSIPTRENIVKAAITIQDYYPHFINAMKLESIFNKLLTRQINEGETNIEITMITTDELTSNSEYFETFLIKK